MTVWQRLNKPRNKREERVAKIARDEERERIIKLLIDLNAIRRDIFGHLVAFNTDGTEVVYLTGLEGINTKVSGGDLPNAIKGEE